MGVMKLYNRFIPFKVIGGGRCLMLGIFSLAMYTGHVLKATKRKKKNAPIAMLVYKACKTDWPETLIS